MTDNRSPAPVAMRLRGIRGYFREVGRDLLDRITGPTVDMIRECGNERDAALLRTAELEAKLAAIRDYATELADQTADDYDEFDTKAEITIGRRLLAMFDKDEPTGVHPQPVTAVQLRHWRLKENRHETER